MDLIDLIKISIPPREELAHVIRLATAAITNRAGFDLDQADDMNTAAEEIFRFLCASCELEGQVVNFRYSIDNDKLEIRAGDSMTSMTSDDSKMGSYCRFIVDKMADSFEESCHEGRYSLLVTKRTGA